MSERVIEQVEQISEAEQTRALLQAMGLPLTYMSSELDALVSSTVEITTLAIQELDKSQPDLEGPAKDEALKALRAQIRATTDIDATEYAFRKAAIQKFGQSRLRSIDHFAYTLSNSVPALVPKVSRELGSAFKQGDVRAVQAHTAILEQFSLQVTLPETPQADVVVAPVKTNVVPFAKVATVGAIVVGIGFGTVAPAAATNSSSSPSPNVSVSAPANQEQPSAELAPVVQSPEAEPSAATPTATQPEATTPSTAPSQPEQITPAPTETQPTVTVEPVVQGVETSPVEAQTPVFSKEVTSPVVTVQEIVDPTADQEQPADEQPDVLTNDELQEFVKKLDPEYAKIYTNLIGAYKSGNLNGFSDESAFNVANPYIKGQVLNLRMSKKVQQELLLDTREFQEILKNNPSAIDEIINDESIVIDDALKEQLAQFIQSNDFVKGTEGLTIEQRIALVKSTIKIHGLLTNEAQRVTPIELAAAKKADAAKPKPAPEHKNHAAHKYSILIPKIRDQAKLAAVIDAYIANVAPDSPFVGQGANFVKGGIKHGVDPLLAVVIAQMDSNLGTKGVAAHYHTNNPWNRDCPDGKPRVHYTDGRSGHNHSACTYDSPEQALLQDDYEGIKAAHEGHDSIFAYLERKYINHGVTTLEDFLAIYTPAAESSKAEHQHLLEGYKKQFNRLYDMAGDSISFGVVLSTLKDLPKNPGSRYTTKDVADAAKPGETIFGPDDPCADLEGNVRVLCAAKKYFGVRYGTADPGYAPKWERIWNQDITSWGGHNPRGWILRNKEGSTNDFLECSGFVAVAFMAAYNVDVDTCSAGFLSDKKNFKEIDPKDVLPGDLVIAARWCGGKQGGHVGLVESYNKKTNKLVTYESSAGTSSEGWAKSGRITHHKIGEDFHYAVRYIGVGSSSYVLANS